VVGDEDGLVRVADAVAAEHLEILTHDPERLARRITHAGAVFLGSSSAEVFGDYGVGPNHTLPTGRTARVRGGLSVLDFLRVRTWLRIDPASPEAARVRADAAALARLEGLEAHARAAEIRSALPARL
jgi:phosphoribosyl-ATP pyrophosphohydrolase/phosphoribosyl-AMP cyclohydrolase/histidinol dehydrogenase